MIIHKNTTTRVSSRWKFFVSTSRGCEDALFKEIVSLFASLEISLENPPQIHAAGVSLEGQFDHLALLNLGLTTASRVLVVVTEGEARSEDDVYRVARDVDWSQWFDVRRTFAIRADCRDSFARNSMFVALKVKDAIADAFRSRTGQRPSVDTEMPDVPIQVRLVGRSLSIAIDTSGDPLSQHGYRVESGGAPLRENLAAALVRYTGWAQLAEAIQSPEPQPALWERPGTQKETQGLRRIPARFVIPPVLVDPMCGTGTLGIEAALMLMGRKPNARRRNFPFLALRPFAMEKCDLRLQELRQALKAKELSPSTVRSRLKRYAAQAEITLDEEALRFPIHLSDMSREAMAATRRNAEEAGVVDLLGFSTRSFFKVEPLASAGLLVFNPPYGERLGETEEMERFYKRVGDHMKQSFAGWTAWMLSGNPDALKKVGLRPTRKLSLFNGELPCSFAQFILYGRTAPSSSESAEET